MTVQKMYDILSTLIKDQKGDWRISVNDKVVIDNITSFPDERLCLIHCLRIEDIKPAKEEENMTEEIDLPFLSEEQEEPKERRYYCKTCRDLMCSFSGKDRYEINCSGVEED